MNNGQRNPQQIENDISHTRAHMSETLDEIQDRLSPGRLLDQALDLLSNKSTDTTSFTSNLTERVKQNPIPTTLIGLGIGWLMMSDKNRPSTETPQYPSSNNSIYPRTSHRFVTEPTNTSYPDSRESKIDHLKGKASSTLAETKNKIGATADTTKERLSDARDTIQHQASYQTERAQQNFNYLLREQPLVLLGAGLAIGAALGAGLPSTRQENKLMGETRDRLVDEAASIGNQYMEKTKAVANSAVAAATEEADREGLTPQSTKNKADEIKDATQRVVNAGKEAAKQEADKQDFPSSSSSR